MKFVQTRQLVTIPAAGGAFALILCVLGGCEDPAASRRVDTQRIITEASEELTLATVAAWDPSDDSADQRQRRLDAIVNELSKLRDAEGGQQVASAMLSSAANRELARMSLARAEIVEIENRNLYEAMHSNIDAALRMQGLAEGIEDVTTHELRTALSAERAEAQKRLRVYSQRLAELDGPIAERETENAHDAREASRLGDEAISLRRQAAEWGHAAGLPAFEQAINLEREADQFEYRIAWRESDLQYDLRPEHELAGAQAAFLSSMLSEIAATEESLRAHDDLGAREVAATRQLVDAFRTQIAEAIETARARTSGELEEHYNQAQKYLEQAVTQAKVAASKSARGEQDAALLMLVRAYEQQGQLFATRGRGFAEHATLLDRLMSADGALGNTNDLKRERDAARSAEADASEQARAQLTNAKEQLEKVKSKSSQADVEAFKAGLSQTLSALGAPPDDDGADNRRTNRTPERPSQPGMSAPTGDMYRTPEELLAVIRSATPDNPDASHKMFNAFHATTPAAKRLVELQKQAIAPSRALYEAMIEHFGVGPGEMMSSIGGPSIPTSVDARLIDQSADHATIEVPSQPGSPMGEIKLVKIDGGWKIDADSMFPKLEGQALQQVESVSSALTDMLGDLAQRVRDGEFSEPEEVTQTMMAELMAAMGGGG